MYFVNCVICGDKPEMYKRGSFGLVRCEGCLLEVSVFTGDCHDKIDYIQHWNDKQTEFAEHIVERLAQPIVKTIQRNHVLTVGWKIGNFERRTKADLVMDLLTGGE